MGQKESTDLTSGSSRSVLEDLRSPGQARRSLLLFLDILSATLDPEELDKKLREHFIFLEATYGGKSNRSSSPGIMNPYSKGAWIGKGITAFLSIAAG